MIRIRERHTQAALAARAGVSREAVSLLERGRARQLRITTAEAIVGALGGRLDLRLLWNGPELDRLIDAGHAALSAAVKRRLEGWGWIVRVEVSFSRYGERGRIDLLGWHPRTRALLVVEVKTELVDVQDLLGSLDMKLRLAPAIAERFGWDVRVAVPAIVFAEDRTTRNRLVRLAPLFDRYERRGRFALSWLCRPDGAPSGLLWLTGMGDRRSRSATSRVRAVSKSEAAPRQSSTPDAPT